MVVDWWWKYGGDGVRYCDSEDDDGESYCDSEDDVVTVTFTIISISMLMMSKPLCMVHLLSRSLSGRNDRITIARSPLLDDSKQT